MMKIDQIYSYFKQCVKVETDTRRDLKNTMFFALKGDNFNGNKFANKALEEGAKFAIIDEEAYQLSEQYILVDNVLQTLQELATYHRNQIDIPILAITGSNGKTTSKELIQSVLKQQFNSQATIGNLNNHIGVPLTLLSLKEEHDIGIVEMGANHPNEIDFLCNIAQPNFGYITNFGKVHLEGFGSLEGVIQSKTEMYRYLSANDGKVFINSNDEVQLKKSENQPRITFGSTKADYEIKFVETNPFVKVSFLDHELQSNLIGNYNYNNIAAAIAIGSYFNITLENIAKGIESYIPTNNRSQIIKIGDSKIILDAYNANPTSMSAALENLNLLNDKRKVAILGDMFELGEYNDVEHQNIVDLCAALDLSEVVFIGKSFSNCLIQNEKLIAFDGFSSFQENIDLSKFRKSTILIKASRGMALERIVELMK